MAKPIKKKVLIHNATLFNRQNDTTWKKENSAGITLSNVLFQTINTNIEFAKGNEVVKANTIMFYDFVNSSNSLNKDPLDLFVEGDIIEFDGGIHHILKIENTPELKNHHLELILE